MGLRLRIRVPLGLRSRPALILRRMGLILRRVRGWLRLVRRLGMRWRSLMLSRWRRRMGRRIVGSLIMLSLGIRDSQAGARERGR
jgi:hypothetical protein